MSNPAAAVQDAILFTFDDEKAGAPSGQPIVKHINHIRCLFNGRWKYARYFDPAGGAAEQYELYDLQTDPYEITNQATVNTAKAAEVMDKVASFVAAQTHPWAFDASVDLAWRGFLKWLAHSLSCLHTR